MSNLKDKEIRSILKDFLYNQNRKPQIIIEEIWVNNGASVADLITVYKSAHCYEIKSDSDNLSKLMRQSQNFNAAFPKITLVTTRKHINNALDQCPKHWGLMLVEKKNDQGKIIYIRKASHNKLQNKAITLRQLWKDELLNLAMNENIKTKKSMNIMEISELLSYQISKTKTNKLLCKYLYERYRKD